ncbi:uncharacterized protein LOC116193692 isoform X2 [Punica granatum]|uniref:Uncharacterized protein LOC116193692 isoform X2 n=1 Tax=Punica granatum TaxID=22663 RepID=A0A6P8C694_PUNGR|nr:uncharacterized protein LOC116193692 isoform X2 [Punica granatum]
MPMIDPESINIDELFKTAMRSGWDKVAYAYTNHSGKIIEHHNNMKAPGETALHVAVAYGKTKHVWDIVDGIPQGDLLEILKMKNDQGDTPLHLAAAIGNLDLCCCISSQDKSLIAERNKEGETPLFQAARYGKEKAFFYLRYCYGESDIPLDMLIKNEGKGDTILHSAINGENYGFALRIIHCYPELVDTVNEKNLTPLHVLALQPRSFPSVGPSGQGPYFVIVYHCTFVPKHTWDEEQDRRDFKEIEERSGNDFSQRPHKKAGHRRSNASRNDVEKNLQRHNRGLNVEKMGHCRGQILAICFGLIMILFFITAMFLAFIISVMIFVLFLVNWNLAPIINTKRKHCLAIQLVQELLDKGKAPMYPEVKEFSASSSSEGRGNEPSKDLSLATPLLTAAKLGIFEMVDLILDRFPEAIKDMDNQGKNAVLLAAENLHLGVYRVLERWKVVHRSVFCQVDADGNSALHLASRYDENRSREYTTPVIKMSREFAWYQYVKNSMPSNSFAVRNNAGQTAVEILIESHKKLNNEAHQWLTTTCSAYSLIGTLIATVAFASSSTIPGEYNDDGRPRLEGEVPFTVFSISSLMAFCSSMSATVFFITILSVRYELKSFKVGLPKRLQSAFTFLFVSIASILVSFISGFYINMRNINKLHGATYLMFAVMFLPVTLFPFVQIPLYMIIRFNPIMK